MRPSYQSNICFIRTINILYFMCFYGKKASK